MTGAGSELESGLVTIVICVYNAGSFLRPAVESILNQTDSRLEVLIVDDGSTDGCLSAIQDLVDPRVRVHSSKQGIRFRADLDSAQSRMYSRSCGITNRYAWGKNVAAGNPANSRMSRGDDFSHSLIQKRMRKWTQHR